MSLPGWVPVATAAETVGRPAHTVWTWVKRRKVKTLRLDRSVLVSLADVERYAATRQTPTSLTGDHSG